MERMFSTERTAAQFFDPNPQVSIRGDGPFNEYFLLRRAMEAFDRNHPSSQGIAGHNGFK